MLAFYLRLTDGLGQRYRNPIYVGFALVIGTFLVSIITIFSACRPFHKYWQINPDPGNACQAAISRPIIWASFATNVSTDIYIILIPIPMLWKSRLKLMKKIAATVVFGAGLFVLVCAILKSVFVLVVSRDVTVATPGRELTHIPAGPRRWRTTGRRMGNQGGVRRSGYYQPSHGLSSLSILALATIWHRIRQLPEDIQIPQWVSDYRWRCW
jgi:hypothetical protein